MLDDLQIQTLAQHYRLIALGAPESREPHTQGIFPDGLLVHGLDVVLLRLAETLIQFASTTHASSTESQRAIFIVNSDLSTGTGKHWLTIAIAMRRKASSSTAP